MNNTIEVNGIKITVTAREVYKENEKYQMTIINNTDKTILIDTTRETKSVTLTSDNGIQYNSNIREIADIFRRIEAGKGRKYKLRFNKIYSVKSEPQGITFTDIVPDYEKYQESPSKYKERFKISVSL